MNNIEPTDHSTDAIALVPTACRDSQIDTGLSKFGGNPDLPDDFKLDFEFQLFIGQINFAQINGIGAAQPLPNTGLLSLFLSRLQDSFIVEAKYFASTDGLQRILLPAKTHPCHPCRLTPHLFQSMSSANCRKEEYLQYENDFLRRFYPHKQNWDFDTPWHQMLGSYQNGKILLLQIDSDSLVSMSWGYNGKLNFWIRQSDLATKNFADIQVELAQGKNKS
ncbi:MAG: YwqG family protein [Candidatus Obscuribacterales bacterium]|nr:YwqG family protein [Candidatus Obscuribacterales bacterium]